MTARADDRIYWAPLTLRDTAREHIDTLIHRCPTAVVFAPTSRDQLDPMALGTCRYCGERLPTPKDTA